MDNPKMDAARRALIEGLSEDLANEYGAVIMYTTYAATVRGLHRTELKGFFEAEVPDELRHAGLLANKISALGGQPTTQPAPVPEAREESAMLRNVLQAELDTIERYKQRRKQAEEVGEIGLMSQLEGFIEDESGHRDEIRKLLDDRDG